MSAKIALDFDILITQASKIDQIGSEVSQASTAARSMQLDGGAFGALCSFMVLPADLVSSAAGRMLADCEDLLHRTSISLRTAVSDAQEREYDIVQQLRRLRAEIR